MAIQNDFYLYLVNGSETDSDASCTLPATADLSRSNYEISLVELQLPGKWHNIYGASITVWLRDAPQNRIVIRIADGYYKNAEALIKAVDRICLRKEHKLANKLINTYFKLMKNEKEQYYIALQAGTAIRFSQRLVQVLGLRSPFMTNNSEEDDEDRILIHPDLQLWQRSLIAECNVVPHSTVGEYSGQVLRVFATQGEEISSVNVHEMFVPVIATVLDRIDVRLCDMRGRKLSFMKDEMVILVHLRKVI